MIKVNRIVLYFFVVVICLITLAPIFWTIVTSISYPVELLEIPPHYIPRQPTLDNYLDLLFERVEQRRHVGEVWLSPTTRGYTATLFNSFIVSLFASILCLLIGSLAAYALSRMRFKGRESFSIMFLTAQMTPAIVVMIPLYYLMEQVGYADTRIGLGLVYTAFFLPLAVLILRDFFESIPVELEDAARIDGCGTLGILFRIVLPLSAPGLVTSIIITFIGCWNDFLIALIFTHSLASKTVSVQITHFTLMGFEDYGLFTAGGLFAAIFPIALALIFQKYIVKGLAAGALKG